MGKSVDNIPLVSVIVPIFDVSNYLLKCIDSIVNQTYGEMEIILIDDGSCDDSNQIISFFAKYNKNIIVISKKNSGVSSARNIGLVIAKGDYISFIDADDYVSKNMIEKLQSSLNNNRISLSCCLLDSHNSNNENAILEYKYKKSLLPVYHYLKGLFEHPRKSLQSCCGKLFNRNVITECFDENVAICEDGLFLLNYCKNIADVFIINENLYHIYERPNSTIRKNVLITSKEVFTREKMIDIAKAIDIRLFFYAQNDFVDSCLRYKDVPEIKIIFKKYIKNNLASLIINPFLSIKLKLLYILKIGF